jgi:5-methylthioadenosine/S-adenosylhomocysteine deaminase
MATIEGAAALGWADEIGSLSVGKRADLSLVDVSRPTMAPVHVRPMRNLVPNLVYAARGDEVETVIIDGQVVVSGGRLQTLAEDEIVQNAQHHASTITPAADSEFWRLDTPNARAMLSGNL